MLKILFLLLIMIFVFVQCEFVFAQDVYQAGIVRLVNANKNIAGAGSIVKVDEETRTAYILTAYHVIEDIKGSGSQIYVEFHVQGRTHVKEAKDNPQWQRIIFEEERDGFAVIYVEDYPGDMALPVIFIDDSSEEMRLDEVTTFGYDYDGALLTTKGPISSLEPILRYDAGMVRPGFSGGPVLDQEGFIIGTNLKLIEAYEDVFAIRAKVFKPVVDSWIGLPRMQLELYIDDPPGAKDGTVSTEQKFTIKASLREDKVGNFLAPKVKLTLNVPEGYQIEGLETMTVTINDEEGSWTVTAPDEQKAEDNITVNTSPEAHPLLAPVSITTIKGAEMKSTIIKPKSSGLTLFVGQRLNVQAVVQNSGDAQVIGTGTLKIEFQPVEFELVSGSEEKTFVVDEPIDWRLRARSKTTLGNIVVRIARIPEDENSNKTAKVIDTSEIFVRVKDSPRWRSYIGFPSILVSEDIAVEAELGAKVRLFNISSKGIPLYVVMSGAFGIYNIIWSIENENPDALEPYTLGTLSLAIPLGPISLQAGSGLNFDLRDEDLYLHVTTGTELNLGRFSIQGGIRYIYEEESSFFLIQMKF